MTEQSRPTPDQRPKIQRVADFTSPEDIVAEERTMEFKFEPEQGDEERMLIVQRVFGGLYDGRIDVVNSLVRYDDTTAFIEGVDIKEKPEKPEEELTDDERETIRLMNKHLVSSEIPPVYKFMKAEQAPIRVENQGPKITRLSDLRDQAGVDVTKRTLSFKFDADMTDERKAEIIGKVFGLLYEGDLSPSFLDLDIISTYVAIGENVSERELKPEDEMTEQEREAHELMNRYLTYVEFLSARGLQAL